MLVFKTHCIFTILPGRHSTSITHIFPHLSAPPPPSPPYTPTKKIARISHTTSTCPCTHPPTKFTSLDPQRLYPEDPGVATVWRFQSSLGMLLRFLGWLGFRWLHVHLRDGRKGEDGWVGERGGIWDGMI